MRHCIRRQTRLDCSFIHHAQLISIGVIYGGTRGTGTAIFWTKEYSTPHFSGQKGEEFAVTCCQQKRSAGISYNKTIFSQGSAPDPARRSHDALTDHRVGWGGTFAPHSPPLWPRGPRASRSPSELVG